MITDDLKHVREIIDNSIKVLEEKPDKALVKELIDACKSIEFSYKKMCKEMDENNGEPKGTNYEVGPCIEFYIEADWWHPISECLRKLFPNEKFEEDEDEDS